MDLQLSGLTAVVTGGSSGIGAGIVRAFAGANWYVDGGAIAHVQS